MEYNLSVPFKGLVNTVEKAVATQSENAVKDTMSKLYMPMKNINFKSWKTWIMMMGIIAVFYLMFWNGEKPIKSQEPPIPAELMQQEHPMDIANRHYDFYQNTTGRDKLYHYQVATRNYERTMQELDPNGNEYAKIAFRLAKMFQEGIPEVYDAQSDQKIPGSPPDTERSITYYQIAIQSGYHSAILDLASIFHWGNVGFKPNREYARHLYAVMLKIGSEYEQGVARDRLRQMREEEGKIIGSVLDGVDGVGVGTNFSSGSFDTTPFNEEFSSVVQNADGTNATTEDAELTKDIDANYVSELMMNDLHLSHQRVDKGREKVVIVENDPHNARDHMVSTTAKQSLEKLRSGTHIQYDMPSTLKMLHSYIMQECDLGEHLKTDAIKVLKHFAANIAKLGYEQAKELEALHVVFNRIQSQYRERKERNQILNNLVRELSECIEYGELVCSEGRVNRIIDTLNHIDPLVNIQPKWALTQEMMNKCIKLRKELIKRETSEISDSLESPNPTARQKMLVRNFQQKLKREIERDFTRTYVDSGIMSKDMLNTELNQWLDSI
jgi:hypothetical protein